MWAKWTQLAAISSADSAFATATTQLVLEMHRQGIRVTIQVQFKARAFDAGELGRVAAANLRVVVVIADSRSVVTAALAAKDRGMLEAGWAWLGLDTVAGAEAFAADGPKSAEAAKAAINGWVYFAPSNTAPAAFFDRVREATRARFSPQPGGDVGYEDALSSPFAANMYDAVMLYALAVLALAAATDPSRSPNGELVAKAMRNVSFDGMTGRVELDENGDMRESIGAMNSVLESDGAVHGRPVGVYDGPSRRYSPTQNNTVVWPGGVRAMPADSAVVQPAEGFNTSWMLVGAAVTSLVVIGGLVVLVRRRRKHLQAILLMLLTEVGQLIFSVCVAIANLATDGIVFDLLLRGDLKVSSEIYTAAYATILCFGVVATALSMGYRIRNAHMVRTQLQQLSPHGDASAASAAHRQAQQHEWELVQTHRTKVTLSLSLTSIAAQGA